jgi:hypothetical protein
MSAVGRKPLDPFKLEPALDAYLGAAKERGLHMCPLDLKTVAKEIGCSHTHFSPKRIAGAPPQYRGKWEEFRRKIEATTAALRGGRRTEAGRLKSTITALQDENERIKNQNEALWTWMVLLEAALQTSGINTEMFIPESLRYCRDEKRRTAAE